MMTPRPLPPEPSLYGLLEIEPSATEEEIRRAYRRMKEIYSLDSPAVYGAYTAPELDELLRRFEQAYGVLMDAERRKQYDLEARRAAEGGAPAPSLRVALAPEPPPGPPPMEGPLGPETVFTGDLLRRVRESRGLSLDELAARSKIKSSYLRALEEESWDQLPASVYVRGFIANYARELKLEAKRVMETYYVRLKQHYDAHGRE
jgi:flagellar biosynthesis protein FlhG